LRELTGLERFSRSKRLVPINLPVFRHGEERIDTEWH
jgi:hypothetical protein